MNDEPTQRNAPDQSDAPDAGSSENLDDTQRVEISRYAPTPDPRPDARWAWASPREPSPGERWYEPEPAEAPGQAGWGSTGWGQPQATASGWGQAPSGGSATPPPPAYAASTAPRARGGGPGIGTIVAAALLSAVVASGGTVAVLDRTGALDRTIVQQGSTGSGTTTGSTQQVTVDESSAVIDVAAKLSPAVVKITIQSQTDNPFGNGSTEGIGSGVIYNANGWILTNRHVVSGATKLTVELKDGRQFDGTVYGIDTLTDLAIVRVSATGLPTAPLGESDALKIGQLVVAIGSPLGTYSFSVTSGIVSGKGRSIQVDNGSRISNLIQTDAAINPGNSGGPLADATGAVVGINTAVATDSSGIGFAIPIDIARPIMEQAVKGQALSRPWIGIRFEPINLQLQQDKSLPVSAGALVSSNGTDPAVVAGSPAEKAGVKDGDIIVSIDGKAIDSEHPLDALLVQFAPGDTVTLSVLRNGSSLTLDVTLGTRPANL